MLIGTIPVPLPLPVFFPHRGLVIKHTPRHLAPVTDKTLAAVGSHRKSHDRVDSEVKFTRVTSAESDRAAVAGSTGGKQVLIENLDLQAIAPRQLRAEQRFIRWTRFKSNHPRLTYFASKLATHSAKPLGLTKEATAEPPRYYLHEDGKGPVWSTELPTHAKGNVSFPIATETEGASSTASTEQSVRAPHQADKQIETRADPETATQVSDEDVSDAASDAVKPIPPDVDPEVAKLYWKYAPYWDENLAADSRLNNSPSV